MAVSVQFEIGHTAKLRAKKTPEGFTHDWDLYVRGSNKADISAYVDKVVFNLHESFQRPKRVIKEPPYVIHESGYASFILNIDIYFRNRDEPKRVQYTYDLDLQQHGPPHHRSEEKKFLFENPSEEFRQKLLKGGGVPVVPAGLTGSRSVNPNVLPGAFVDSNSASSTKHKSSSNNVDGSSSSSSKKHKSRIDDSKLNTFANLFGTPDAGAKSSPNIPSKNAAESLKTSNSSGTAKIYSPSSSSTANINNPIKEKSSKEGKDKPSSSSGNPEKSKDKSERKEKHKSASNSSPTKEARNDSKKSATNQSIDTGKSEKRSEDKPKKDKSRDKERERSRNEQNSSSTPNSSNIKPLSGVKSSGSASTTPVPPTLQNVSNPPGITAANTAAQRTPTQNPAGIASRAEDKLGSASSKSEKSEKETKDKHSSSSSSGKKSKKEKKDKDKDKEKEKERDKDKRSSGESKAKDERTHLTALQSSISNSPSGQLTPNSLSANSQSKSAATSSKKSEKDSKQDSLKTKTSALNEKTSEKQTTASPAASNNATASSTATDKKSAPAVSSGSSSGANSTTAASSKTHKHKKKDKNKDKDKDKDRSSGGGDKEKDKSKDKHNKEKPEEKRETEKLTEVAAAKAISPDLKKIATPPANLQPPLALSVPISQANNSIGASANTTSESTASSKKSQNKEKKSKDSKSSKDAKRRSEAAPGASEPKSKVSKTSTPLSTAGSNIELSDADSRQSTHDTLKSSSTAPSVAPISTDTAELHSDSSYSSFPDIPVKQSEKPAGSTNLASPEKMNNNSRGSTTTGSKENKQREKDKNASKSSEKSSKADKEEKKRRRSTMQTTPETTTFVEPPVKQSKKEQSKTTTTTRDSTKSPLPRGNSSVAGVATNSSGAKSGNTKNQIEANNQDIEATATMLTVSPNATATTTNHTNNNNNNVNNSTQQRTTPLPASPALNNDTIWPNLSELQELHRKIMTLQDNDDLQQVVEMIAASGCYELTQRTFDFDLCKLDRSTVERLQEFFATSVS